MIIGSHDPLLDELADMLHLEDSALYISSSHVGSMGGIMAIRRGEAHMAGCHLLDTADGSYNKAFIRKYFPKGGVKLVSCVGRQQGLMVAKGNPLQIRKFADIAKDGVRYVNRQKDPAPGSLRTICVGGRMWILLLSTATIGKN